MSCKEGIVNTNGIYFALKKSSEDHGKACSNAKRNLGKPKARGGQEGDQGHKGVFKCGSVVMSVFSLQCFAVSVGTPATPGCL